jgi:predicted aspartyl protease
MRGPAFVLLAAAAASTAHAGDCGLQKMAGFDMQGLESGRVEIPASLDGKPYLMMLDTGAPIGILDTAVADELELKRNPIRGPEQFYSASGASPTQFVAIPSVKLGQTEAAYTEFLIGTFTGWPPHFGGTIASDILKNFDLDLDFGAQKANLFSQDHCDGKVVYWAPYYTSAPLNIDRLGYLIVDVTLDGQETSAEIDTGSPDTILNETASKRLFGIDTASPGVETAGTGGDTRHRYKFKSLAFAGISIPGPRIFIAHDLVEEASRKDLVDSKLQGYQGREAIHSAQMVLGTDILRRLHLYIAYKEKKIYLTAADTH